MTGKAGRSESSASYQNIRAKSGFARSWKPISGSDIQEQELAFPRLMTCMKVSELATLHAA